MKKSIKSLLTILVAGAIVLSSAACGGNSSGGAGTSAPETSVGNAESGSAQAKDEPVVIRIAWWGGDSRHAATQKALDLYTSLNPTVTFETSPSGWDGYFEKLATETASGHMPDIVQMDYLYISTYANNGSLADLNPYIENGMLDVSGVSENLQKSGKVNGKLVGQVLSSSLLAMTYNPEVLSKAGVDTPDSSWTWADFTDALNKVADVTGLGISTGVVDDTNIFSYWLHQNSAKLYAGDNLSLGYDDDKLCAEYFTMWKDLMDSNAAADPDEYAQISTLGVEADPVVTGGAGFTLRWNNYTNLASANNDKLKMVTPPLTNDTKKSGLWLKPGMFFSVAETSKVKDEAVKFINWFINSNEANDVLMGERGTPVVGSVRDHLIDSGKLTPAQQDMFAYVTDAAQYCGETPSPDPSGTSEISEAFKHAAYSVFYGQADADTAAATFRKEADEILKRNNSK